ncbi:MAG: diguanylate cyclase, partial [Oscillospiraceae bacterium]|nr:diguanylate cyclase [Oscillospiraceae bacterium]
MINLSSSEQNKALPGIRYLFDTASRRLAENSDECHALILIDIDNFADNPQIITKIGTLLSNAVSKNDLLTRYGDDRFAVFTSGFSNRVELEKLISKLLYRINFAQLDEIVSPKSVSGAAMDEERRSAADMFMCAEIAISKAKLGCESGFVIFSKEDEQSIEDDRNDESYRPRRKIQRVLNYAFEAFVKPNDSRLVIKDVLAYIGEEYGFRRIFLVTGDSISGSVISWNGSSVSDISESECLKVLDDVRKSEHVKGKAHIKDNRYSFGMMEGYTLTSVVCYEDDPSDEPRSEAEQSEMRTLAKMFSVYKATVLSSMSAEDELIY